MIQIYVAQTLIMVRKCVFVEGRLRQLIFVLAAGGKAQAIRRPFHAKGAKDFL
jgi:hypothetical protein